MTLDVPYKDVVVEYDWLSCCIYGCADMNECDRKYICDECVVGELPITNVTESSVFVGSGCC